MPILTLPGKWTTALPAAGMARPRGGKVLGTPRRSSGAAAWRGSHRASALADRHHSRFGVSIPVRCTPLIGRAPRTWRGRTANVSGGGLAVDLPARLRPHTRLSVEIRTGIGSLRIEADVQWTRRVAGTERITRHGLCLAGRSEVLDLPIHALLGQWLQHLARREAIGAARTGARQGARAARGTGR